MANGIEVAKAYVTIVPTMQGAQQTITEEMTDAATPAGDAAGKAAGDAYVKSFGDKATSAGKKLTASITAPILGLGIAAVKTTVGFDESMSKVAAISGATGDDFDALREKAKEMGSTTRFSASEAADAMSYMAMAGWKTNEMMGGIEGIMNLAAASGEDLATTSDIVTDALTAFGLKASDSGRFADVLAAASSNANTNVSMMGETFKYAAPVAGALGFTIEDTAQAIGLIANAGIKGSQAGSSLRNIFNSLSGPIKISGKNLKETTIQTTNADGSMRELSDILADCRDAFGQLSESEQAQTAESIFGRNAMSAWLALMNAAPEDIDKLSTAIDNSAGAAKDMAEIMQNNLGGQWTELKSALEGLAISAGDLLVPALSKVVGWLKTGVEWLNQLDPNVKKVILTVAGVLATVGPMLIVIGKVSRGLSAIGRIFGAFGKSAKTAGQAVGAVATPFGTLAGQAVKLLAVGAAFVGIAYGMTLIAKAAQTIASTEGGVDALLALGVATAGLIATLAIAAPALDAGVYGILAFSGAVLAIGGAIRIAGPYLEDLFNGIGNIIDKSGEASLKIGQAIATVQTSIFNGIANVSDVILNGIATVRTAIANGIATVLDSVGGVFESIGTSAKDCGEGFSMLADGIVHLTKDTGVFDLGGTLLAVAGGIGAIMAEAAVGGTGLKNVADLGTAFVVLGTNADTGVDETISAIDRLKTALNNTVFRFPSKLELPHITANTGTAPYGQGGGTPPSWNVKWYDQGGIFNRPSIIGVGERRPEFVGALDDLRGMIREEAGTRNININGTIRVDGYNDGIRETIIDNLVDVLRTEVRLA